ncbi:MAG TPA: D-alanyl-D-alanine carboxypeptidase family protein [Hyphomicrobiaceae bacterium]|nr:D-alanyl-D-alanine carboxypeptidase family protein [Hyphomicrobiaceae bacterium]
MDFTLCRRRPLQGRETGRRAILLWRHLGAALIAVIVALQPLLAEAAGASRHAVLMIDANTGRVLYQRSADAPRYPASLTKLMTLYLLFEALDDGRLSLDSKIRFSAHAVAAPPSNLDVEEGTEIELRDAIRALIVKSANDVAVAIGERIAGSEEHFAELMTRKAHELGMKSTQFRNASGLTEPDQRTTARDMTTLALRLMDRFPKRYPLFATRTFSWGGDTYRNHNGLLFSYRGVDGMKTGYTRASGFNVVASARRGRKHILIAYFGGKTARSRNAAVRTHLNAGFVKASEHKTRRPEPLLITQAKAPPLAVPRPQLARAAALSEGDAEPAQPARNHESPARAADTSEDDDGPATQPNPAEAGPSAAVEHGAFQIQVGAFESKEEAARQLAVVRERAATVLDSHAPRMTEIKRGDKVLFRARYVGFEAQAAAAGACSALKRMEIDCLVMRVD